MQSAALEQLEGASKITDMRQALLFSTSLTFLLLKGGVELIYFTFQRRSCL